MEYTGWIIDNGLKDRCEIFGAKYIAKYFLVECCYGKSYRESKLELFF